MDIHVFGWINDYTADVVIDENRFEIELDFICIGPARFFGTREEYDFKPDEWEKIEYALEKSR